MNQTDTRHTHNEKETHADYSLIITHCKSINYADAQSDKYTL